MMLWKAPLVPTPWPLAKVSIPTYSIGSPVLPQGTIQEGLQKEKREWRQRWEAQPLGQEVPHALEAPREHVCMCGIEQDPFEDQIS